jgi:MFS family permease
LPSLRREYEITGLHASLLSSSVSAGFVVGTLVSAILDLADRADPRRLFMVSAILAAGATELIAMAEPTSAAVIGLRFAVGVCMAGIYPIGMKLVATWAKADMGLLVGILVGALTLGTAAPHLIDAIGGVDWRLTLSLSALLAAVAALMINFVGIGERIGEAPPFDPRTALEAWRSKPLRLANLGYLGHMWELFAMWAWIGVFLQASFAIAPGGADAPFHAKLATFATIGVGALGCFLGGVFADRFGRTALTMTAMAVSGACALVVGLLFGGNPWLLTLLCLVWGFAAVADSAQFSASVMELADPSIIGTMVTVQTCVGFLLTVATIHMIPPIVEAVGWQGAFATLAIGPFLGVIAMGRLRAHPDAAKLAGGKR